MAGYGGQLVALNAETPTSMLEQAAQAQDASTTARTNLSLAPIKIDQAAANLAGTQLGNDTTTTNNAMLRQRATLQTQDYNDARIAHAAAAIDPADPDAATKWDEAMGELNADGVTSAGQFVGRYNPALARRITDGYSAKDPTAMHSALSDSGTGAEAAMQVSPQMEAQFDQQFSGKSLPELQAAYQSFDGIRQALTRVQQSQNPSATWDQEAQRLGHTDWVGKYSQLQVAQMMQEVGPLDAYLQKRVNIQGAGGPSPLTPPPETKEVGGVLWGRDPKTGQWSALTSPTNKFSATQAVDRNGNPIILNTATGQTTTADGGGEGGAGSGGALESFADKVIGHESGGNATAQNSRSSAGGAAQFLDSTWLSMMKANRPDLTEGKSSQQILAMKTDPTLAREMTIDYARENAADLARANHPVTGATLGLAHSLGIGDANKVLDAAPGTPLSQLLSPDVMRANPNLAKQTAGSYVNQMIQTYGVAGIEGGGAAGGNTGTGGADASTGPAYLATLAPSMRQVVQAVIDGRTQLPASGRLNPYWTQVLQNVTQADPTFNQSDYNARAKTRAAFTSGVPAANVTSLNTAIGHLDQMDHAIDQLGNTPFAWWNAPAQWIGQNVGDVHTQTALKNFNVAKGTVASEVVKALRGSGGAEADIQYWLKLFDSAESPAALHAAVESAASKLGSRVDALTDQYNTGMGTTATTVPGLSPKAAQALDRLQGKTQQTAAAPASGQRLTPQQAQALPPGTPFVGTDGVARVRR